MKKNCNNCAHLSWEEGETNDPSGWCCLKREYGKYGHDFYKEEQKHLDQLERESYREKSKSCFERGFASTH